MKFTKSNFSKDELEVLFYALSRFRCNEFDSLRTAMEAAKIAGSSNENYIASLRQNIVIIDGLKSDLISCMLSHSGS